MNKFKHLKVVRGDAKLVIWVFHLNRKSVMVGMDKYLVAWTLINLHMCSVITEVRWNNQHAQYVVLKL